MGPFFQFILAESWGCPGMLRMPSGFKAWRLFAHGLQTLSRLLNARALSGSNPQLSASLTLKKGPIGALFYYRERALGIRALKNEAPRWTPHLVRCDIAPALHLGCLGYGLALGCERAVVDAAAQAIELHEQPFNGIRPCTFLVGN